MNDKLHPGMRVAYADLPPHYTGTPDGTVVEPSADELAYGLTYDPPYRPAQGDVVVLWDGDERWEACWQRPSEVRALPQTARADDHCGEWSHPLSGPPTTWCVRPPGHGIPHRDQNGAEWRARP